jgi:acyl dehydratase
MSTLHYEDIQIGEKLGELTKGPMSPAHIMRWSAAVENWHRIHYDVPFATGHDKLPNVLVNGSWKQHVLVQLVKDALGPDGWLWKIRFRYQRMDVAGDTIHGRIEVTEKQIVDGLGFVTCRVMLKNQRDEISTAGWALGVVPLTGGQPVPYPFVAKPEYARIVLPREG